jgi:hypothetical protein
MMRLSFNWFPLKKPVNYITHHTALQHHQMVGLHNTTDCGGIFGNNLFETTSVYGGQPPANLRTPRSFAAKRKVVFISCSCCFQSQHAIDSAGDPCKMEILSNFGKNVGNVRFIECCKSKTLFAKAFE